MRTTAACLVLVAACGVPLDDDIAPIPADYQTLWGPPVVVTGEAPGHADSYRAIYANELARDSMQSFDRGYQEGAIFVKEIRDNNDGEPGDLRYVAIMRRIGPPPKNALEDQGGWVYTQANDIDEEEKQFDFCWNRCHAAAPYNGAWYDYRE